MKAYKFTSKFTHPVQWGNQTILIGGLSGDFVTSDPGLIDHLRVLKFKGEEIIEQVVQSVKEPENPEVPEQVKNVVSEENSVEEKKVENEELTEDQEKKPEANLNENKAPQKSRGKANGK